MKALLVCASFCALLVGGCSPPSNPLLLDVVLDENIVPTSLDVSIFDNTHALVLQQSIPSQTLSAGRLLFGGLPGNQELRVVVVGLGGEKRLLGAVAAIIPDGAQAEYPVLIDSGTLDSDGDAVPDKGPDGTGALLPIDNCPFTFNPDQASASGGEGDACKGLDFSFMDLSAGAVDGGVDLSTANDLETAHD